MAFEPIFRWLQDAIIPRNPDGLDFLQPAQCADADDLAVAALSFRGLMAVDQVAGLNLNHRKCCSVQHGSERRESVLRWVSDVGTMIGQDGHIHRWTAPPKKSFSAC